MQNGSQFIMCSKKECLDREMIQNVSIFEQEAQSGKKKQANYSWMVKKYMRLGDPTNK